MAGLTIPLVDPIYTIDDAAGVIEDGPANTSSDYLKAFSHLAHPGSRGPGWGATQRALPDLAAGSA